MWFIGVEVEQETSAPPPKKNPGSVPGIILYEVSKGEFPEFICSYLIVRKLQLE